MTDVDRKLHTRTIARMRQVTDRAVRKWITEKGLRAERTSGRRGHYRVKESDLRAWLREREQT